MSNDVKNNWYVPTVNAQSVQAQNPATSTQSQGAVQQGNTGALTQNVHDKSTYQVDNTSAAQAGHRILAQPPPVPEDGQTITPQSRLLATQAATRMTAIGQAMQAGGPTAGIAMAIGSRPDRSTTISSSSSPSVSTPTASAASTQTSTDPETTKKLNDAASRLSDDCKSKGACGKGEDKAQRNQFEDDLQGKDNLTREQAHWVYEQIRSGSVQGQALAKAVVAANYGTDDHSSGRLAHQGFQNFLSLRNHHFFNEPTGSNPNGDAMRQQFGSAVAAICNAAGAPSANGQAGQAAQQSAAATLAQLPQTFGLQVNAGDFINGPSSAGSLPTSTTGGWQVPVQ